MQSKAQQAEAIRAKSLQGRAPGGRSAFRLGVRLRASLPSTGGGGPPCSRSSSSAELDRCPMCSLPNSNLHLAMDCSHSEIGEVREDAFRQFAQLDTAMLEWQGNGIPESWAEAWPQLSRAQQLVAVIRAEFSPGNSNPHLCQWGLVSTTLRAAWPWEQMASSERAGGCLSQGVRRSDLSWINQL